MPERQNRGADRIQEAFTKVEVDKLNEFLRVEKAAVETYSKALDQVAPNNQTRDALKANHQSHVVRVRVIEGAVHRMGSEPARSSGLWGTIAGTVHGAAKTVGTGKALAVLREGERRGLRRYTEACEHESDALRRFVGQYLLPEQRRSTTQAAALASAGRGH